MKRVTAGLLIKDGLCLIAKRRAGDSLANYWEFPGGKTEVDETPEECLRREMYEELQIIKLNLLKSQVPRVLVWAVCGISSYKLPF